jgi:hypothetical protein
VGSWHHLAADVSAAPGLLKETPGLITHPLTSLILYIDLILQIAVDFARPSPLSQGVVNPGFEELSPEVIAVVFQEEFQESQGLRIFPFFKVQEGR